MIRSFISAAYKIQSVVGHSINLNNSILDLNIKTQHLQIFYTSIFLECI